MIPTKKYDFSNIPGLDETIEDIINALKSLDRDNFAEYVDMAGKKLKDVDLIEGSSLSGAISSSGGVLTGDLTFSITQTFDGSKVTGNLSSATLPADNITGNIDGSVIDGTLTSGTSVPGGILFGGLSSEIISGAIPIDTFASGTMPSETIAFCSDNNKLCYKDNSGTIHALY